MAILSDYEEEDHKKPTPSASLARKLFTATLNPSDPLGFLEKVFEFVESNLFKSDSLASDVNAVAEKKIKEEVAASGEKGRGEERVGSPYSSRKFRIGFMASDGKMKVRALLQSSLASKVTSGNIQNLGLIRVLDYTCNDIPTKNEKFLIVPKCTVGFWTQSFKIYAREIDGIGQVVVLDNDKASVESCRRNTTFNGSVACSKVESNLADARVTCLPTLKNLTWYAFVDLDPYGSPSVFLDSAVQPVVDRGILMCIATDMAVLCEGNGESAIPNMGLIH
ncbi:probable tRNA (guanine(26)-n(2))-dimethyltransferase 2 [Phtheirospermum japonicum]|uniref:tRNA (guanine(26)-N(2))-dimethyltransferase n=1 Tax=Phtheirospermum japonicum TaxID=374723 RepID=A0A830BB15_9LAMI|nr:probable tRNA (guanine(26)-n(2))-dimethyltransferase 2 [Phtheirospermum japonicum]